jgi:hypothetical protein
MLNQKVIFLIKQLGNMKPFILLIGGTNDRFLVVIVIITGISGGVRGLLQPPSPRLNISG